MPLRPPRRGEGSSPLAPARTLAAAGLTLALGLLLGCAGDSVDFKTPDRQTGLALQDSGLDPAVQSPLESDPSRLEEAQAFVVARDAARVLVHFATVRLELLDEDFDPAGLDYTELAMAAAGASDALGWIRYETVLPSRPRNEALLYWFRAEDDTGLPLESPEGGAASAVTVMPDPIVIDFPWPAWPPLVNPIPCVVDLERIYDGGPNEATLVPAPQFDPIRTPIWKTPSTATVLGNRAGVHTGVGVEIAGEYYFFPLAVMLWNEVSNQSIGGRRTGVSYCPLTDTALHFDTGMDPDNLPRHRTFAPAGLYNSNLSVGKENLPSGQATAFNQMMGFGFTGPQSGQCLLPLPSVLTSITFWKKLHPDTKVLEGDPDLLDQFDYSSRENPYHDYWRNREIRFPVGGEDPQERLHPKARVLGIMGGGEPLAVSLAGADFVHHDRVRDTPVVIFHQAKTAICLERQLPGGPELEFVRANASWNGVPLYKDLSAAPSLWTSEGVAISGPLSGQRLAWVPSMSAFWFAWYAMYPETRFVADPTN